MIFGQSGGGRKVATLLAMPSAKGLFHRATIESGATLQLVEREQGTRVARELMSTLGIAKDAVRDLQTVPLDTADGGLFRGRAADERRSDDAGLLAAGRRHGHPAASVSSDGVAASRPTCR